MSSDGGQPGLIQQVQNALVVLYTNADPQMKHEADTFLHRFQNTVEAWQIADQLLFLDPVPDFVHYFAAQTLHTKIKYDMAELPPTALGSLRDSLVGHILRLRNSTRATITRLCVALAKLAVQMENWTGVIPDIVKTFMSQNGTSFALLEVLSILPEEASTVPGERGDVLHREFLQSSPSVLGLFVELMQKEGSSPAIQSQVLRSVSSWIAGGLIAPDEMARNPLLPGMFDALSSDDLFDDAVDAIVSVLRAYEDFESSSAVISFVVPRIMQLKGMYVEAAGIEDYDTCRGLCRIFTEMAESYILLIIGDRDVQQGQILDLMLQCTSHPESDISEMTLNFWFHLLGYVRNFDERTKASRMSLFWPVIDRLEGICMEMLEYPEDVDKWKADKHDDFRHFRTQMGDALLDCADVLGATRTLSCCLTKLRQGLEEHGRTQKWMGIEAALYGVRCIARVVPREESEVLPQLFSLIPQLPTELPVRYTATLVIGRYSEWIEKHSQGLLPLFNYVLHGIPITDKLWMVSSASAMAVKSLCRDCGHLLGEGVLQIYDQAPTMQLRDEVELLEGLVQVLSRVDVRAAEGALRHLVGPIARRLGVLLGESSTGTNKDIIDDLRRLTAILGNAAPAVVPPQTHPTVLIMREMWPLFEQICVVYRSNGTVIEDLCRLFKHSVRACRHHFAPLLEPLAALLVQSYGRFPVSSYLYCASICISEFAGVESYKPLLMSAVGDLAKLTFSLLKDLDAFTNHPDVVEEFFYLIERAVKHLREPLLQTDLLRSVVRSATMGLQVQHQDANKAVLTCIETTIQMGLASSGHSEYLRYRPFVANLLSLEGEALVDAVMDAAMGALPLSRVQSDRNGSLSGVLERLAEFDAHQLQSWIQRALSKVPESILTEQNKMEFFDALFTAQNERAFRQTVYGFSLAYRNRVSHFRPRQ